MKRRGSGEDEFSASGAQSWRALGGAGGGVPSKRSRQRRRRRVLAVAACGVLLLVLAGALAALTFGSGDGRGGSRSAELAPPSKPVERIIFETDGMLPDAWLRSVLDLAPGTKMLQADLGRLEARLEAEKQVKSATVERVFPSDLRIRVKERVPVLRMVTESRDGRRRVRLVARDGTLYSGVGYPEGMLRRLPYLRPYQRPEGGVLPLAGMETVAAFLETARRDYPELYRRWRVVSLEDYSGSPDLPGELIAVRSASGPRVLFDAGGSPDRQLKRLRYILDYARRRNLPPVERIDLSLRGSAAVQFTDGRKRE